MISSVWLKIPDFNDNASIVKRTDFGTLCKYVKKRFDKGWNWIRCKAREMHNFMVPVGSGPTCYIEKNGFENLSKNDNLRCRLINLEPLKNKI